MPGRKRLEDPGICDRCKRQMRHADERKTGPEDARPRRRREGCCTGCADARDRAPRVHRPGGVSEEQVRRGIELRARLEADRHARGIPAIGFPMPGEVPDKPDTDDVRAKKVQAYLRNRNRMAAAQ